MHFIFKLLYLIITASLFGTGTKFLTIPANGLELAIGAHAIQKNGINPAAAINTNNEFLLNIAHGSWLGGSKLSAMKVSLPGQSISYGLELKYVDLDDLELRTERPTDDPLAFYGASGFALGGSFSKEWKGMAFGAQIHYIRIDLYSENSSGYGLDFGMVKTITPTFELGAAVLNAGRMSAMRNEEPQLPLRIIATTNLLLETGQVENNISISGEWSSLINSNALYISSSSRWNNFVILAGSKMAKKVIEISGGVGLQFGIYNLNYGTRLGSLLENQLL